MSTGEPKLRKSFKFNVILYLELVKISKYSINTSDSDFKNLRKNFYFIEL
jgi:hypothetical protein